MLQRHFVGVCLLVLAIGSGLRAREPVDIAQVLHDWQQASQAAAELSVDGDLAGFAKSHSAHELEAAAALLGPVNARALAQQFEWTAAASDEGAVVLTAVPRDPLGRLFFSAVALEFDAGNHLPRTLRFRDPNNELRTESIAVPAKFELRTAETAGAIQLVALVESADAETDSEAPTVPGVLQAWADATRAIERADIEFTRFEYDHLNGVEKRSHGRFHFEGRDRGIYERQPDDIAADAVSRRTQSDGSPFQVEADTASLICWDTLRLVIAYPEQQAYDEFPVPKASTVQPAASFTRAWYSLETPSSLFPATIDVHSRGYLQRFEWSLLDHDERRLVLQGRPVSLEDQLEVFELQVVLDPTTYLAQATRLIPADRNREIVHVLSTFTVNPPPKADWRPDLSGWQKYEAAPLAPPAEEE